MCIRDRGCAAGNLAGVARCGCAGLLDAAAVGGGGLGLSARQRAPGCGRHYLRTLVALSRLVGDRAGRHFERSPTSPDVYPAPGSDLPLGQTSQALRRGIARWRLRRGVPRLPVLRGAGPGSRAFGAHYRGGADVARRVRRPLSRPTSAGDVWAQPTGEALGWVPVGMSLLTGTYLLIAGRGGLVFVGGVPLRGHGAQLPVLGDCQDRGPQPGGGAAHGGGPGLAAAGDLRRYPARVHAMPVQLTRPRAG